MMPQRREQIRELLEAARKQPIESRAEFLARACSGDLSLCNEIERLLAESTDAETATSPLVSMQPGAIEMEGRRIGAYEVIRAIGGGGMGTVYLARRADKVFEKQVALKIVRGGQGPGDILRRFEQERQILASLDHPNIARLLDGGSTPEGLPYLVMEYIAGTSIVSYCDSRQLDITARLRLFQAVCAAVQYAHERRVVHRDLKPSNILVTEDGTVKLLDFGIAKLLEANSPALLETKHGLHVMTPEYASPEQVQGGPITTSTDVYGLGVVLYELITGRSPHRLKSRALHEIARVICEEEPIVPSKAVSQPDVELKGPSSDTVGTVREGRPDRLKRRLAGDLDHIVLKALRKEPARRYASAEEFREDIARHLQGLPIKARKDNIPYRAAKLLKRNWTAVMTAFATVAAIALVAVIVGKSAAYREDRRLRQILEEILVTDLSGRQGSNPDAIFSEWSRLRERFNLSQSGSSKTDLSILARRAAVRAEVTQVPPMGLKSDSPGIRMTVRLILDIGRATPTSVDFEVRDNNGPWRPLTSIYCKCDISSPATWSVSPLDRFISPQGPTTSHHLEFRAKLMIFDSASESVRAALNGSRDERARALAAVRPVSTETRPAGSFDFKPLRDIPEDYPPAVEDARCETELASQFQLKRVRIVRTSSTSSKPNLISRIEMFGVFGVDSGCPIAAEVVLRQGGRPQPLVRFPVAIGRNVCVVGPGFSRTDAFLGPVANIDRIRTWKYIVADFRPYGTVALPDSLADGAGAGQVDFEPSRIVARRARLFDRYWGKALRFAVELVISTGE